MELGVDSFRKYLRRTLAIETPAVALTPAENNNLLGYSADKFEVPLPENFVRSRAIRFILRHGGTLYSPTATNHFSIGDRSSMCIDVIPTSEGSSVIVAYGEYK